MKSSYIIITFLLFITVSLLSAQPQYYPSGDGWEVEGEQWDNWPTEIIQFETDEGTWINLDISPDGNWIVFDLIGNIYRIPFTGGEAVLLSGGEAYDQQPRYNPDGTKIAFTSDRGGADNIWIMDADGENRRAITHETDRLPSSPCWTPDGDYIVMRKHFRYIRSIGAGEIWMHHIDGGAGVQLVERQNWQADQNEPAVSSDGRWVYYSFFTGLFEYNRDPHRGIYQINRYDRETGRTEPVTRAAGGAVRPTPSPDGKKLAFVRRVGTKSVLFIRDLNTGAERAIFDGLDLDQQETWAIHGVYPAFSWTPDNRNIIISFDGGIHSIDTATGDTNKIQFTVNVEQRIADAVHFEYRIPEEKFQSRMIRWPSLTPDSRTLVFQAAGHLYIMRMPDGNPERITGQERWLEYAPAISPDGRWVAFTTWNDNDGGGHLYKTRLDGSGSPVQLTKIPDQYTNPSWSPDGEWIAFLQGSGIVHRGKGLSGEFFLNIRLVSSGGGEVRHTTETANRGANRRIPRITWEKDGSRIYYFENYQGNTTLTSVQVNGTDKKRHMQNEQADEIILSPDGKWVAFKDLHNVYVTPFPKAGNEPHKIERVGAGVPVKNVTRYGGDWITWTPDSRYITFNLGNAFYKQEVAAVYTTQENQENDETEEVIKPWYESNVPHNPSITKINLEIPRYRPKGSVVFINARIITMHEDEIIENGGIVVEQDRIQEVGPADQITIPRGAKVFDLEGKTVIPGFIDVHAHAGYVALDITPDRLWEYEAQLAYGVTTTHDPSASTQAVYAFYEQVEAGRMTGPRIYSTGFILYGAENPNKAVINTLDDARAHLRRHKAQGGFSVKSYNQLRRDARQWVMQAAREEEMLVYPEGASMLTQNITHIIDGHTGIEHAIPVTPLRKDMLTLLGRSNVGYTPTLVVGYGGIWGENYWYQVHDVYKNERLLRFVPQGWLDARSRRRMLIPEEEFYHFRIAESAKAILDAGGYILLGAHGQLQGLAAHWELWMFVQGGMTEMEALRAATLHGARYIGLERDLGSIEEGKLADFVILNSNPLDDIKNSEDIFIIVKNGQVWDEHLNELYPRERERKPYRFETE